MFIRRKVYASYVPCILQDIKKIERGINGYEKLYYTILISKPLNQILNFWINNFL